MKKNDLSTNDLSIEYLFIRLLEACNSNCFMCDFSGSRDSFRLSPEDFRHILRACREEGVKYIRFSGGEPLLDPRLPDYIAMAKEARIRSSVITNGLLLPMKIEALAAAGLDQVIVSIDSPDAGTHNKFRRTPKMFERAVEGLKTAARLGINTRVNTVCGKHNFADMLKLQDLLTEWGVDQWELSAIKLNKRMHYSDLEIEKIRAVNEELYNREGKLIPTGARWSGNDAKAEELFFQKGIAPLPSGTCHIVDVIRYLDAKNGTLYICSLNPHRLEGEQKPEQFTDYSNFKLNGEITCRNADYFRAHGPKVCTGCSSTAAGLSDQIQAGEPLGDWYY